MIIGGNEEAVKASTSFEMKGEKYQYDDDEDFPISQKGYSGIAEEPNSFGTLTLEGDCSRNGEVNKVKAFDANDGNIRFFYRFSKSKLGLPDESWNVYDSGCD